MSDVVIETPRTYARVLAGELLWVAPSIAISGFLVSSIYRNTSPEKLAAVIGVLLAAVAIVVAILIYRLQLLGGHRSRDLLSAVGRPWYILSYLLSLLIIVATIFGPSIRIAFSPGDSAYVYLARDKKVRIGVNGRLPGWSLNSAGVYEGFDISLVSFLVQKYGFVPDYVPMNQEERRNQWNGAPEKEGKVPVDIVISTFSVTQDRLNQFDMAGPYYTDSSTTWRREKIHRGEWGEKSYGCAVGGTSGESKMTNYQTDRNTANPGSFDVISNDVLADCFQAFFDDKNKVQYMASDWSILRAYDHEKKVMDAENPSVEVEDATQPDSDGKKEFYGIAFRNNHPNLCRELTDDINSFLNDSKNGWDKAWEDNLEGRRVKSSWHKPGQAKGAYCSGRMS